MADVIYDLGFSPNFNEDHTAFAARESGLHRTTDGGKSWINTFESLGVEESVAAFAVAVSPNYDYDKTVFAGSAGVVLKSTSGGERWSGIRLDEPIPLVSTLAISPNYGEDGFVYAGTLQDGVFTSANRGEGFTPWNYGLLDQHVYGLTADGRCVYAGVDSGVYCSPNRGRRWDEVGSVMEFAPVNIAVMLDDLLLIASEESGLYLTRDGGKTVVRIAAEQFPTAVNQLKVIDHTIVAASDFEIWVSADKGNSWKELTKAPGGTSVMTFALSQQGKVLAGYSDGRLGWYDL
jgi:photosystem II stability/assembly factor-like uncharacterized protein